MDRPFRLVFDFDNTLYGWKKTPVSVGAGPVKEIRGSQSRGGVARFVIELARKATYRIERQADGIRVVFAPSTKAAPPTAAAPTSTSPTAPTETAPTETAPTETAPTETALPTPAPIPTKPPATVPATNPAKPKVPPLTWRLQGTVVSDDASTAYIADPVTSQVKRYVVGDRIGDGLVGAIEERRVVLRMPRSDVELLLEEFRSAPSSPEQ